MEKPDWLHPRLNISCEFFNVIKSDLKHHISKKAIARINSISKYHTSATTKLLNIPIPKYLPEIVCFDETKCDVKNTYSKIEIHIMH